MRYTVYWTRFAEEKLDQLFTYYSEKAGARIAQKMINEIIDKSLSLENSPRIGQIEPLLSERKEKFRNILHKNYKLIYWINDLKERIEIVNLFDCRQDPALLINQTES